MKKFVYILLAAVSIVCGCTKENSEDPGRKGLHFTAGIEQPKTYLKHNPGEGGIVSWAEGDRVSINGVVFEARVDASDNTRADFAPIHPDDTVTPYNNEYVAYFPSTITNSTDKQSTYHDPILPESYGYGCNRYFGNSPMCASVKYPGTTLSFTNFCGVLELNLKGPAGVYVTEVSVTSGSKPLCGSFTWEEGVGLVMNGSGVTNSKQVKIKDVKVPLREEGVPFYLPVPPETYDSNDLTITVKTVSNTNSNAITSTKTLTGSSVKVVGNTLYAIPLRPKYDCTALALPGRFSVGPNRSVIFAAGNLYYDGNKFAFEQKQYHFRTFGNMSGYRRALMYNGAVDYHHPYFTPENNYGLFGWSSDHDNSTKWGMSTSTIPYDYDGKFVDWGDNIIYSNYDYKDYKDCKWRTLSYGEWSYILNSRPDASSKWGYAYITGIEYDSVNTDSDHYSKICGLVILPDSWTLPDDCTFTSGQYSDNSYTLAQWAKMEAAGAVFLPSTLWRDGENVSYTDDLADWTRGVYWSSSHIKDVYPESTEHQAFFLNFQKGSVAYSTSAHLMHFGCAVRLVLDNIENKVFSVSDDKKVRIAKSNLWCEVFNPTSYYGYWHFEDDAWDCEGANASYDINHVRLFYWDGDASEAIRPWPNDETTIGQSGEHFIDVANRSEGYHFIIDGEQWYILTADEWAYLYSGRLNAANLFACARIKIGESSYVNGCVFCPDSWTAAPSGLSFTPGTTTEIWTQNTDNTNTYTKEQWAIMEDAGAVFLPCGGVRNVAWDEEGQAYCRFGYQNQRCLYYSGTSLTLGANHSAYYFNVDSTKSDYNGVTFHQCYYGCSIRCVKPIDPLP